MAEQGKEQRAQGVRKADEASADIGGDEVQRKSDEASDKGFLGTSPDPTPNENYSLETGEDAPTPETDPELAREVGSRKFAGSALEAEQAEKR